MAQYLPLAIDAMGGDKAPKSVIRGLQIMHSKQPNRKFLLYGDEKTLQRYLDAKPMKSLRNACEIIHTNVVISDDEKPSIAVRQAKNSSMRMSIQAVKDGKACGVVSSGNTGAFMALSKMILRTLPSIYRPALTGLMPNRGSSIVMLDIGANVQCDANDLFLFALMGDSYSRVMLQKDNPKVALLNIGSEEMKGHETLHIVAENLRSTSTINFKGYVEGNDICNGDVDVVVTDGFTGNIALKTLEGTARYFSAELKQALSKSWTGKLGYMLARPAFAVMKRRLDPRRYNGAMFLGLDGIAIKSHGGSDGYAFYHAMKKAYILADCDINSRLTAELARHNLGNQNSQQPHFSATAGDVMATNNQLANNHSVAIQG